MSQGNLLCIVILRPLLILDQLLSHNSFPAFQSHYEIHFLARRPNRLPLNLFHSPNFGFPQTQFSGSPIALQQNASCSLPFFLSMPPKDPTDHLLWPPPPHSRQTPPVQPQALYPQKTRVGCPWTLPLSVTQSQFSGLPLAL